MSVIVYNSSGNNSAKKLQRFFEIEGLTGSIEKYRTIEELSCRLSRTEYGQDIAVIFINGMQEFHRMLSIKKFLNGMRIILILPDRSAEIVAAGYKLYPRFIGYSDGDFNDVMIVLRKMIKLMECKSILTEFPSSRLN